MTGRKNDEYSQLFNRVNERSVDWARERAKKEIGSHRDFWNFIADGLAENIGVREMIVRFAAKGFSRVDAERLIETAVATANENQNLEAAIRLEGEGRLKVQKGWSTGKDEKVCGACRANEAQGWIGLSEPFQSGHMCAPAHIGCRCSLIFKASERGAP